MHYSINIRKEVRSDHKAVFKLIKDAFSNVQYSDHKEQYLVERLRHSAAFIPELSLVAEVNDQIAGHILLTKIEIVNYAQRSVSLALAPVAVHPEFQNRGIGAALIEHAHRTAKDLGYSSVILLGHADYYPRFGYVPVSRFDIELPFEAPDENCLIKILDADTFDYTKGLVEYPKEFFEEVV
ncbi:N-acetyltransferase [Pseudoflavitalea sp. G-6-1-2]|uniref:GNAT family N-acetyltransferase n=1 Tax=Pseudoflavitalea sp. G-6-1-2 TaxID=2728841 RepID=UPI00197EF336|nr:N-acetyltransferase [Pseudoflavitalea sp. G-6-1-2]